MTMRPLQSNRAQERVLLLFSRKDLFGLMAIEGRSHMQKVFLLLVTMLVFLSGCASFNEKHHFRTVNPDTGEIINYMRLTIKGEAHWSKANYCSGYFDEKVLEKFFSGFPSHNQEQGSLINVNDKDGQQNPEGETVPASPEEIPDDSAAENERQPRHKKPPKQLVLEPLGNDGTLTLILSTNASGVLNAIDAFAENENLANAVTNLINRDKILEAYDTEDRLKTAVALSTPLKADLDGKFTQLNQLKAPNKEETRKIYLEILSALSRANNGPDEITTFEQAVFWISTLDK